MRVDENTPSAKRLVRPHNDTRSHLPHSEWITKSLNTMLERISVLQSTDAPFAISKSVMANDMPALQPNERMPKGHSFQDPAEKFSCQF